MRKTNAINEEERRYLKWFLKITIHSSVLFLACTALINVILFNKKISIPLIFAEFIFSLGFGISFSSLVIAIKKGVIKAFDRRAFSPIFVYKKEEPVWFYLCMLLWLALMCEFSYFAIVI